MKYLFPLGNVLKCSALVVCCSLLAACSGLPKSLNPNSNTDPLERAQAFFDVYIERQDFARLMDFYAEEARLEDLIFGHVAENKAQITEFLNWNDGKFSIAEDQPVLVLESLIAHDDTVVAEGYFTPFQYNQQSFGPWRFVTLLRFDNQGLITKHTDWINYTPREKFLSGENLNDRIR